MARSHAVDAASDEVRSEAEVIHHLADKGERMIERLRRQSFLPERRKSLNIRFGVADAAALLGCSTNRIRMAEDDGRLPAPLVQDGRRLGYDVAALLHMREVLQASPRRGSEDAPVILAVQNFKGGVGKSTVTTHLAHYLAIAGYRILVVDCDSQATTTTLFGFNPQFDIDRDQTLYPYLSIDPTQQDLLYAVQRTPWPNVDLIPSCLELFDVEYELAASSSGQSILAARFRKLKQGLNDLAKNYDVVILDPPPALGTVSLAVMQAANALLVPLAATIPDFCSTVQFLSMMDQVLDQLHAAGVVVDYQFCRLVCSRHDTSNPGEDMVLRIMEDTFGSSLMPVAILDSAEISHAALRMMSVYELDRPIGTPKTHKRCRSNLDEVFRAIETLIRRGWNRPTRLNQVRDVA
jgi:chromosome partitioning protein